MDGGDGVSSNLQIISDLEGVAELQARAIKVLATRLAELGGHGDREGRDRGG